jgi:hypothetical protein
MPVEKVSAGPAMQRPQPAAREVRPSDVGAAPEGQIPVGGAPGFDRAKEALITPKAGMLANPVVQQYTSAAAPPTAERPEMKKVDAGSITMEEKKKPREKRSPQKKRQKQDQKPG